MKKILFVCTGNSARSQMAEGFARAYGGGLVSAASAGLDPQPIDPRAIEVMRERGIDINHQKSKLLDEKMVSGADVVVTLCGDARERCPVFPPEIRVVHWPLEDPKRAAGSPEQALEKFRQVRDQIESLVRGLIESLA